MEAVFDICNPIHLQVCVQRCLQALYNCMCKLGLLHIQGCIEQILVMSSKIPELLTFQPGASYLATNHMANQKIGLMSQSLWCVNVCTSQWPVGDVVLPVSLEAQIHSMLSLLASAATHKALHVDTIK